MKTRQVVKKRTAPLVADGAIFLGTPGPPLVEHAVQRPVQHQPRVSPLPKPCGSCGLSRRTSARDYLRKCKESSYTRVSPESNT